MIPRVQCVRILGMPFSLTPTATNTTTACRMTVGDKGNSDDHTSRPVYTANEEEVRHRDKDHQEDYVSGVVESHCGGVRCGDNIIDSESAADSREDPRYGEENHGATEEFACKEDPRGTYRIASASEGALRLIRILDKSQCPGIPYMLDGSGCCKSMTDGDEETGAVGRCIPDGVYGCRRATLLKSTCCGPRTKSIPGTACFMSSIRNHSRRTVM